MMKGSFLLAAALIFQDAVKLPISDVKLTGQRNFAAPLPGLVLPIRCSRNGDVFARFATGQSQADMYGFPAAKEDLVGFSVSRVNDISNPIVNSTFPGDRGPVMIVTGVSNPRQGVVQSKKQDGTSRSDAVVVGTERQFVVKFDWAGNYLGSSRLDLDFEVMTVGMFSTGELLVAGRTTQNEPRVAILQSNGQLLRALTLTGDLDRDSESLQKSQSRFDGETVDSRLFWYMARSEIIPFNDKLILLRKSAGIPLFEVTAGGEIRRLSLSGADGALFTLRGDKNRLIGQFTQGHGSSSGMQVQTLVFDSESGKALGRLAFSESVGVGLACYLNGKFTFLKRSPKGEVIILSGNE